MQIHSFRHMQTLNTHDPMDSPRCPQNPMLMDIQAHIRIPFPSAGLPPYTCMCTHIEVTEENSANSSADHTWSTSGTASSGPRNLYPCVQAPFWGSPWLWESITGLELDGMDPSKQNAGDHRRTSNCKDVRQTFLSGTFHRQSKVTQAVG